METRQPKYRFAANIGDMNPFESGRLLCVDATGVYPPRLVVFDFAGDNKSAYVSHIDCERCTMLGVAPSTLSDNHFRADKPAWFADKVADAAECVGVTEMSLACDLCGMDVVKRAIAYDALINYFGTYEFDQYPVKMTRAEIRRKYRAAFKK